MTTNFDKYNSLCSDIRYWDDLIFNQVFGEGYKLKLYLFYHCHVVDKVFPELSCDLHFSFSGGCSKKDKPTRDDIAKLKAKKDMLDLCLIGGSYRKEDFYISGVVVTSRVVFKYGEIADSKDKAFTLEELKVKFDVAVEAYHCKEDEGKCVYCHQKRKKTDLQSGNITYINRGKVVTSSNLYCKDKPCQGYHQMAHEG